MKNLSAKTGFAFPLREIGRVGIARRDDKIIRAITGVCCLGLPFARDKIGRDDALTKARTESIGLRVVFEIGHHLITRGVARNVRWKWDVGKL